MFMQEFSRQAATATLVLSPADAGTAPGTATAAGPRTCGLVAKTLVETADGWKPAELLRRGEALQTQDGGLARVLAVDRQILMPATHPLLVHVPGGAFDACSDLLLLPDQLVLLDTLDERVAVAGREDALFVLVPALALIGLHGVRRHDLQRTLEVITPRFAEEEMVYAQTGVLLRCPGIASGCFSEPAESFFPELGLLEAMALLRRREWRMVA